jgi:RNA polymerase-binding transcription factor DksA
MLYIKTKLKDGRIVKSGIQKDNTYAVCSECGKEIPAVNQCWLSGRSYNRPI